MTKNELMVENWNLKTNSQPIEVRFWTGAREGEGRLGKTWTPAQMMSGTAVVYIRDSQGKNVGAVALSHVEAI
jgi:hypothetical protein